jgi:ribosome-binding factor A
MSIRTDRVARMIQREIADLLQTEFSEATHSLTTVTGATVSPDLGVASIQVSVLGDTPEARRAAFSRVEGLATQVRHALAQRIRHQVRRIPEVRFFLDEGPQRAARMDEIFARIAAERGDAPPTDDEADEEPGRGDY